MIPVSYPDKAPSVCAICESVPPETAFVDTLRDFQPGGYTHLNGRKYICENCVTDAAQALSLFDEVVAPVQAQVDELSAKVAEQDATIDNFQTISDAIAQLAVRPVIEVEPTVEAVIETAKAKRVSRKQAAADAQAAVAAAAEAEAAGAAAQAAEDQRIADERQAASVAALNTEEPVAPEPEVTAVADASSPPVEPVIPAVEPVVEPVAEEVAATVEINPQAQA